MATPTITGTPTSAVFTSSTTWTDSSHTVPGTGSNRGLVVVQIGEGTNDIPTSVFWNTTEAMTLLNHFNGLGVTGGNVYFLANPTPGNFSVVVNLPNARAGQTNVFDLKDVAQTSTLDTSAQAGSGASTSVSQSITTGVANTFILSYWVAQSAGSPSYGGSQTPLVNSSGGSSYQLATSYSLQPTAGSITHSYTWSPNAANDMGIFSLKGAVVSVKNAGFLPQMM